MELFAQVGKVYTQGAQQGLMQTLCQLIKSWFNKKDGQEPRFRCDLHRFHETRQDRLCSPVSRVFLQRAWSSRCCKWPNGFVPSTPTSSCCRLRSPRCTRSVTAARGGPRCSASPYCISTACCSF